MVASQGVSERMFGNAFRKNTFKLLVANPSIDKIIDTQAQNTHKILEGVATINEICKNEKKRAKYNKIVKFHNFFRKFKLLRRFANDKYMHPVYRDPQKRPIKMKKVMTDLPNRAQHFYKSLSKVNPAHLSYLELELPNCPDVVKNPQWDQKKMK